MHKETVNGLVQLRFKKFVQLNAALDQWEMIVDKSLKNQIRILFKQGFEKSKIRKFFKVLEDKWDGKEISKVELYYFEKEMVASRSAITESFNSIGILSITDTASQKILLNHLVKYNEIKAGKIIEHPEIAFSPDGIDEMNRNISDLNDGKFHQPIFKVRTFETKGSKFKVGSTGNKVNKYVEAAKGTNLFFAIYQNNEDKRSYESIPLNIVIERQKQGLTPVPEINDKEEHLLFHLSPSDLVYIPTNEEQINNQSFGIQNISQIQNCNIYKMVSSSGSQCFFVRHEIASPIWNKVEFSALNKTERSIEGIMIKDVCYKLSINRLGFVKGIINGLITNNIIKD